MPESGTAAVLTRSLAATALLSEWALSRLETAEVQKRTCSCRHTSVWTVVSRRALEPGLAEFEAAPCTVECTGVGEAEPLLGEVASTFECKRVQSPEVLEWCLLPWRRRAAREGVCASTAHTLPQDTHCVHCGGREFACTLEGEVCASPSRRL